MGWHNEYWKHIYREYKIQPYKYLGRKMVDKGTQNKKKMLYETIFMIAQINQAVSWLCLPCQSCMIEINISSYSVRQFN